MLDFTKMERAMAEIIQSQHVANVLLVVLISLSLANLVVCWRKK